MYVHTCTCDRHSVPVIQLYITLCTSICMCHVACIDKWSLISMRILIAIYSVYTLVYTYNYRNIIHTHNILWTCTVTLLIFKVQLVLHFISIYMHAILRRHHEHCHTCSIHKRAVCRHVHIQYMHYICTYIRDRRM